MTIQAQIPENDFAVAGREFPNRRPINIVGRVIVVVVIAMGASLCLGRGQLQIAMLVYVMNNYSAKHCEGYAAQIKRLNADDFGKRLFAACQKIQNPRLLAHKDWVPAVLIDNYDSGPKILELARSEIDAGQQVVNDLRLELLYSRLVVGYDEPIQFDSEETEASLFSYSRLNPEQFIRGDSKPIAIGEVDRIEVVAALRQLRQNAKADRHRILLSHAIWRLGAESTSTDFSRIFADSNHENTKVQNLARWLAYHLLVSKIPCQINKTENGLVDEFEYFECFDWSSQVKVSEQQLFKICRSALSVLGTNESEFWATRNLVQVFALFGAQGLCQLCDVLERKEQRELKLFVHSTWLSTCFRKIHCRSQTEGQKFKLQLRRLYAILKPSFLQGNSLNTAAFGQMSFATALEILQSQKMDHYFFPSADEHHADSQHPPRLPEFVRYLHKTIEMSPDGLIAGVDAKLYKRSILDYAIRQRLGFHLAKVTLFLSKGYRADDHYTDNLDACFFDVVERASKALKRGQPSVDLEREFYQLLTALDDSGEELLVSLNQLEQCLTIFSGSRALEAFERKRIAEILSRLLFVDKWIATQSLSPDLAIYDSYEKQLHVVVRR